MKILNTLTLCCLCAVPALRAQDGADLQKKADAEMQEAADKLLAQVRKEIPRFSPEAFEKWLAGRGADAAVVEGFRKEWNMGADSRITDRAVRKVDEGYRKAVESCEGGDPKGALSLAEIMASTKDAVVRAHARFQLARTLLDEDDPEGAADLLKEFIREDRGISVLDPEAAFYLGYAQSLVPSVAEAILNLDLFLQLYPDAPERYRANAQDLLAELQAQWDSPLHALADEMKACERKLKKEETGNQVQTKQLDIVSKLQKLIEQLEQQQQQGGGGGPPQGNQQSNGPASNSQLPGGSGRVGPLHGSRGVRGAWGNMEKRDREKVLNDIQTRLPERYRPLLEKYYRKINR